MTTTEKHTMNNKYKYCPTTTMCADLLTKPLGKNRTKKLSQLLNLRKFTAEEGIADIENDAVNDTIDS